MTISETHLPTEKTRVILDADLAEKLIDYLRAQCAKMYGPNGESPPEWADEPRLKSWIEQLNIAIGRAGRTPR